MMLSLICSGLNEERLKNKQTQLVTNDLEKQGGLIVYHFYESAFEGQSESVRIFVEKRLITPDGVRLQYPVVDSIENEISLEQIRTLEQRRLIRRESREEGEFIELIHDRLVDEVRKARDKRDDEKKRRKAEKRANDAVVQRNWTIFALVGVLIVAGLAIYFMKQALDSEKRSASFKLAFEAQQIMKGTQSDGDIQAYLKILAAYQSMPNETDKLELYPVLFSWLRDNQALLRITKTDESITALAVYNSSPGTKKVVSGGDNGTIRLWTNEDIDLKDQSVLGRLPSAVTSVAFSLDGKQLVWSIKEKLQLYNFEDKKVLELNIQKCKGDIIGVAFSEGGTIISISSVGELCKWNFKIEWDEQIQNLEGFPKSDAKVAFNADGTQLVSLNNKTIQLWDAISGKRIIDKKVNEDEDEDKANQTTLKSVAFNQDGTKIVSVSSDQSLRVWDISKDDDMVSIKPVEDKEAKMLLQGLNNSASTNVLVFIDNHRFISGDSERILRMWDISPRQLVGVGHGGFVASVAYSPDGELIASGSYDYTLRLWDASTGNPIGDQLKKHTRGGLSGVAFSSKGKWIVSSSYDKKLGLWERDPNNPKSIPVFKKFLTGHKAGVSSVAFNPIDENQIVSGSDDTTVRLWNVAEGKSEEIVKHADVVTSVAFSHDGKIIVSGSNDKDFKLWSAKTTEVVTQKKEAHTYAVTSVAFNRDGTKIVTGSKDQTLRVWDVNKDGKEVKLLKTLSGHGDWVSSVAFSKKEDLIVSGSRDRTARLWDASQEAPIGSFVGHQKAVWSVAFSPNGEWIVSGSGDNTLRWWPVYKDSKTLLTGLCKKLTINKSLEDFQKKVSPDINGIAQCLSPLIRAE